MCNTLTSGTDMSVDADPRSDPSGRVRVLVVDDEPAVADVTSAYVERELEAVEALVETSPWTALERITSDPSIDCVIADYRMPVLDGFELLEHVRERRPDVPFVFFSAVPDPDLKRRATEADVAAFVEKDGSRGAFEALVTHVQRTAI